LITRGLKTENDILLRRVGKKLVHFNIRYRAQSRVGLNRGGSAEREQQQSATASGEQRQIPNPGEPEKIVGLVCPSSVLDWSVIVAAWEQQKNQKSGESGKTEVAGRPRCIRPE
jgi:hypothetical protein